MSNLIEQLLSDGPVVTDGAWGTELQARGLPTGHCPDEWNRSHPERVEEVARAYVEAGSGVILTNTFRANHLALANSELADDIKSINRTGAEISLRAANGRARVFGSIGPSGKLLFTGQVSEEDLQNAFAEQANALADAGVEALVIETMSDLAEARVALVTAKRTGLPVIVCMVFDSGKEQDRTMMGSTAEQVAKELTDAGADVIGANCGQGVASYVEIFRQLLAATDRPVWIKPNAGVPQIEGDNIVYDTTAEEFAEHGSRLIQAGASFLGGCCGTGPEFIRALKRKIR
ncbi:MAG TPA: homocysteine S-methyltransferase family protein [Pirellulaceae bacterium]|jgi:methionine synthase I (cobalamin-dependent)|nr:homocysteine S-methyltransferase family protein [Pirellulaceae bacterium]